jgi:hypothetical protein
MKGAIKGVKQKLTPSAEKDSIAFFGHLKDDRL